MARLKNLAWNDPERAEVRVFESYEQAKEALWEMIFEMYDEAKEELKKHGDYNDINKQGRGPV